MIVDTASSAAALEDRRRLAFRAASIALLTGLVGFPLGMAVGGSENHDAFGGALMLAAIAGFVASPWIVRAWQSWMRRRMVAVAVANRPDIRHVDGERDQAASHQVLASDAFSLAAFRASGLVEPFASAGVDHILAGDAHGVPFALAEITLLDDKGYRLFGGVLASFRLSRSRPGLTLVARDHGLLGNLLAHAGSALERLPLEDPVFEGIFEAYGTDQVGGRVILTTTMLERLRALDDVAHAHGFACAFLEDHILIAFRGMTWRCAWWRILQPLGTWLDGYAARLGALVDMPVAIVQTLNLDVLAAAASASSSPTVRPMVPIDTSAGQVFSSAPWRLVGEAGMPLIYVASGSLFGGLAAVSGWYGVTQGFSPQLFWPLWGLITAGIVYGGFAIASGGRELARLLWRWNAPLRTLKLGDADRRLSED